MFIQNTVGEMLAFNLFLLSCVNHSSLMKQILQFEAVVV